MFAHKKHTMFLFYPFFALFQLFPLYTSVRYKGVTKSGISRPAQKIFTPKDGPGQQGDVRIDSYSICKQQPTVISGKTHKGGVTPSLAVIFG